MSHLADESDGEVKLFAYRSNVNKLIIAATLLIPFGFVGAIVLYCTSTSGEYALNAGVEVTVALRVAMIIHGAYFISLTPSFELFLTMWPMSTIGKPPARPDNGFWMMTCLAGELFFVSAVAFFLIASQTVVPRWTLIIPLAQCAYNLKNDLLWVGLGTTFSPEKKRIQLMALDWLCIGAFFIVYMHHFFTAKAFGGV